MSDLDLDEFDRQLEGTAEETQVVEIPLPRLPNTVIKDLIVDPAVAKALVSGVPIEEIAETLGVSESTIRKWMSRMEMSELLRIESKRVVSHLSKRDLSKEKYLGLATALSTMIDKVEMLENGLPQGSSNVNTTIIQNIKIGLFGRGAVEGSAGVCKPVEDVPAASVRQIPSDIEANGEEGDK